jgi:Holliday junction resolvase RusA-like endonuclease
MTELRLEIPMIPPSGNHYKTYRVVLPKNGAPAFVQWYPTKEAEDWWGAVAIIAAGRCVLGHALEVSYIVFRTPMMRADTDNFAKCILDALTKAGVIEDDRYIDDLHCHRRTDRNNPRTVIIVKSAQAQLEGM